MATKKTIAVVGATGAQGGGLARAILNDPDGPFTVRALTRHPDGEKGAALSARGADVVAADLVIASTGNTTCQQILAATRPWLAIPEWRYFDEQHRKADALAAAGVACVRPHLPSSADAWGDAIAVTLATHAPDRQRRLIADAPAADAARWLETLADRLWTPPDRPARNAA